MNRVNERPEPQSGAQGQSITSGELLKGGRSVKILHNGQAYQLTLTKQDKLILTK